MPPPVKAMPASINMDKIVPAMEQAIGWQVDGGNIAAHPLIGARTNHLLRDRTNKP
jgi:hypothetical protein